MFDFNYLIFFFGYCDKSLKKL